MKRVAYFGGSFDPPHLGHHQIVEYLAHSNDVDEIWIVPTSQNPLKDQKTLFSVEQRKTLLLAWKEDLEHLLAPREFEKIKFIFAEIDNMAPSYTVDTLLRLKGKLSSDDALFLVLGEDNLASFTRWKDYEKLLALIHSLWVFPRKSQSVDPLGWPKEIRKFCPLRWTGHKVEDVSSTQIRQRWLEHQEFYPQQLTPICAKILFQLLTPAST